jgi:serine/threonine-protein kinase
MPRLEEFVGSIVKSGLMSPDELATFRLRFCTEPAQDAAVRFAHLLIEEKRLTQYQARKLLTGATKGFFLNDFVILRRVGQGGMGKVFLARRISGGEEVAVKVLPPRKALEETQALARFRREMDLSQRVKHPNIARTLEVGESDGIYFMVMEFVRGDSLFHMIRGRPGGAWRVPDTARYFLQVLDGLEAAHKAGLVHRDLKPSNLMVTPEGDAVILDLGLARALEDTENGRLTRPNLIVGTLDYASPEQLADAAKADGRSDIYSLGCTIYFTLAGRPPFPGGDAINKIYKQRMEDPPFLERQARGVPPAFAAIVRKMMAKNPADRYQNVASLRNDLERWTNPEVVRAIVGAEADAAAAFRPPPPELEEEDLKLLDEPASSSGALPASNLREIGEAEPAAAPRNRPPEATRPAVFVEALSEPTANRTLRAGVSGSDRPWLLQLVAVVCVLAAVALVGIAIFRH